MADIDDLRLSEIADSNGGGRLRTCVRAELLILILILSNFKFEIYAARYEIDVS